MHLRQLTSAFLYKNNEFLLMKKQSGRLFDFEHWSSLGGHIESGEMNTPRTACLREVFEESNISEHDITDFRLKYILMRKKGDEIRQHFVYFGEIGDVDPISSAEGELFWIDRDKIVDLNIPTTTKLLMKHYIENKISDDLTVGVVTVGNRGDPTVQWTAIIDPQVF